MRATEREFAQARDAIYARLRARRGEIQEALLTRVFAVREQTDALDPDYAERLRAAVCDAVDHYLESADDDPDGTRHAPAGLLAQARMAVRHQVTLDTVIRRCVVGQTLLTDFLVEEAEAGDLDPRSLRRLLKAQAAATDQLVSAVAEEHRRESARRHSSVDEQEDQIRRLLDGEPIDTSRLDYRFAGNHVGAVAAGTGAATALRRLASPFDDYLQIADRRSDAIWAWFGSQRPIDVRTVLDRCPSDRPIVIALGEPARGPAGWRLTHRQARATMSVAERSGESPLRYADVALLASILRDDLLCSSLRSLYLTPLSGSRDGGEAARATLRAYFRTKRNISSAAAILGVHRRTVANRLQAIEGRLQLPLDAHSADIETALKLQRLDEAGAADTSQGEKSGADELHDLASAKPQTH